MKAVNVDDVLKILHKYGEYTFVTDEKRYSSMVDEIANLNALEVVNRAHWLDNNNGTISCSRCCTWFHKDDRYPYMRYCPYCNIEMAESEED